MKGRKLLAEHPFLVKLTINWIPFLQSARSLVPASTGDSTVYGSKIALLFNSYTLFTGNIMEVVLGVQDFSPGIYSLTVTVRDVSGQTASQTVDPITLSGRNYHHQLPSQPLFSHKFSEPPLSPVECTLTPEGVAVLCRTPLDDTMVPLTYTCSYNNRPSQDCELGLPFLRREF